MSVESSGWSQHSSHEFYWKFEQFIHRHYTTMTVPNALPLEFRNLQEFGETSLDMIDEAPGTRHCAGYNIGYNLCNLC